MGQCAITGKIVPEDELVMINGQLVCAEGKAILLERLKAGEALPGELEKPSVLRRFGCIFLDGIIIGIPTALMGMAVGIASAASAAGTGGPPQPAFEVIAGVTFLAQTIQLLYFALMHGSRGQTVGKMAGKLQVVYLDGSKITMGTGFVRALAYVGPGYVNAVMMLTGSEEAMMAGNVIVWGYAVVNVIMALVDRNQQRSLHDRIAGTRVVLKAA